MRKFTVAALAIPVLATIYAGTLLRRYVVARVGVGIALGAVVGLGAIAMVRPTPTTATLPTDIVPLTGAAFRTTVGTNVDVDAPVTIEFTTPMDPLSVEAAITVEPRTGVLLRWDDDRTTLTITPESHWSAGAYHTITVQPGALAETGRPLTTPARSSFLTRGASTAVLTATSRAGKRVAADTAFAIVFERPVDLGSLRAAVRMVPAVDGALTTTTSVDGAVRAVFTPSEALDPNTRYTFVVDGVLDEDGVPLDAATLKVRTTVAPEVVRFRPRDKTGDVARDDAISVRFTRSMDRSTTKAAFAVTADGEAITGKIRFAEDDMVLVFVPTKRLPYDAKVVATVAATATSDDGVPLAETGTATFRTVEKPKPKPKASPTTSIPKPSGGGSVGSGSWTAVERYYLGLMNCTRTGGWVTSGGDCSSPGGRDVPALKLSSGISSKVSRPYAKILATRGACDHFIGGNPGDRLRRAGYTSYRWAENLGCRSGNPFSAVLGTHRFFQSEKSYNGGHWVNLMSTKYDRVGIGVWVSSGRVRLVVDFYRP